MPVGDMEAIFNKIKLTDHKIKQYSRRNHFGELFFWSNHFGYYDTHIFAILLQKNEKK